MSGTKAERVLKYLIGFAAIFALVPILIAYQDIWDGRHAYEAINLPDLEKLQAWLLGMRWTLQYYMYRVFWVLQDYIGIPYKIPSNILAFASVIGISVETFRLLREELKIEKEFSLLAVLAVLVCPPWATLTCSVLSFHISCVWAFMLAVRFRETHPFWAGVLFIYSLSLNSIFAFAVGYAIFNALLVINARNWKSVIIRVLVFGLLLTVAFGLYRHYFPPYGDPGAENYNSFNPRYSGVLNNLLISACVLVFSFVFYARKEDAEGRSLLFRRVGGCLVLLFFAGLAYWYVGKPIKVEGTNSFTPRQAYLTVIPMAMLIAVMVQYGKKRFGAKIAYGVVGALLLVSFIYQFVAYQQKFVHMYYENILIDTLSKMERPEPGIIQIMGEKKETPKEFQDSPGAGDQILLQAFGEKRWVSNLCMENDDCDALDWDKTNAQVSLVERHGIPAEALRLTKMRFTMDNFDAFGNPLYYYYYFTNDFKRMNPRLDLLSVEKF